MELRLENYVVALGVTSDIENLGDEAPQIVYKNNPANAKTNTFVVATVEPVDVILPLNVVWIDWNPNSVSYKHALKRISKDPDPSGKHTQTWEVLYYYKDIWGDQFYDADDLIAIGDGNAPAPATTTDLGIVRLATEWTGQGHPKALIEGDPRLTDSRDPKAHSHPEKPATMIAEAQGGVVNLVNGTPVTGAVIVASGPGSAGWKKLQESDLQ